MQKLERILQQDAQLLEEKIESLVQQHAETRYVLLILSAVNQLDTTALGMLTELESSLAARQIILQFAEVKSPVLDRIHHTPLGARMAERSFLSTHQAFLACANALGHHSSDKQASLQTG